jgi:hypothetical protein
MDVKFRQASFDNIRTLLNHRGDGASVGEWRTFFMQGLPPLSDTSDFVRNTFEHILAQIVLASGGPIQVPEAYDPGDVRDPSTYVDSITFRGGPMSYAERKKILEELGLWNGRPVKKKGGKDDECDYGDEACVDEEPVDDHKMSRKGWNAKKAKEKAEEVVAALKADICDEDSIASGNEEGSGESDGCVGDCSDDDDEASEDDDVDDEDDAEEEDSLHGTQYDILGVAHSGEIAQELQYLVGEKFVDEEKLFEVASVFYDEDYKTVVGTRRNISTSRVGTVSHSVYGRDGLLQLVDKYSALSEIEKQKVEEGASKPSKKAGRKGTFYYEVVVDADNPVSPSTRICESQTDDGRRKRPRVSTTT